MFVDVKFTRDLENKIVFEGDPATFECSVNHADAAVEWYLNDERIQDGDNFSLTSDACTRTLQIADSQIEHTGIVRVQAARVCSRGRLIIRGEY